MRVQLVNCQRRDPVPLGWLARIARRAVRRLRLRASFDSAQDARPEFVEGRAKRVPSGREGRASGVLAVTFVDSRAMRRVNRQFLRHRGLSDVVCFRYGREPVLGEILVSPAFARAYAKAHRLSYRQELARYVVHGLLHWKGYDDRTPRQRGRMRKMEDKLLA